MEKSFLISEEENNKFQKLIDPKCKTLSVAVARIYLVKSGRWELAGTGLVSLTKDNDRRNYFLQFFNMDNFRKSNEFEIVFNSVYEKHIPQIHTVCTANSQALFSFADCSESEKFLNEITKIIKQRKEQREKKRMSQMNNTNDGRMAYSNTVPVISTNASVPKKVESKSNKKSADHHQSSTGPKKLTKDDISNPSNFQHLDHMGLTDHFFTSENDANLRKYFKGTQFESLLDDKDRRKDIYDFVEKHGGMDKLETEMKQRESKDRRAPAIPKNMPTAPQKQPPPPPPSRPPQNVYVGPSNAMAKPIVPMSGAPPPPPPPPPAPPPPPSVSVPACPAVPKPSQNKPVPVVEEPRGGLLSEIEKFNPKNLKASNQSNPRPPLKVKEANETIGASEGGSILESLAAFLADRQNLMQPNNSDDSNSESDDEDWKD